MSFQVGDRVVATEEARTNLFPEPRESYRVPVVGQTVGTVTKVPRPGVSRFYGVQWDRDAEGEFPPGEFIRGHQYSIPQLEWLLAESEMEKHVPTTNSTPQAVEEFEASVRRVAARAKRAHPGKVAQIDQILAHAGIKTIPDGKAEPARGSIVRHPLMSIVYTRPWSAYTDGASSWRVSGSNNHETWEEVLRLCGGNPVVLVEVKENEGGYADADARHNIKSLTETRA